MTFKLEAEFHTENAFKYAAHIFSPRLWVTQHGLLTDGGVKDHFGKKGFKHLCEIAPRFDHLTFSTTNANLKITDELGRDGLNLRVHPCLMLCLIETGWRFSSDELARTLEDRMARYDFLAWADTVTEQVCERDGLPYRPLPPAFTRDGQF